MPTRTALVTGATGAIGGAIALGLLERRFHVILVARDARRGERAARVLTRQGKHPVSVELCDVARHADILSLAHRLPETLDVLVNAAAECPRARQETAEDIELQWATNVLGYYWMMHACLPALVRSGSGRVVNVASYWAGGLELGDVEFQRRPYDNDVAYRQSKQADRMLSRACAERFRQQKVSVFSCHPGDVASKLSRDLGFGGHESAEQGADTPLWLATSEELEAKSGGYFARRRAEPCTFSEDRVAVGKLVDLCEEYA